MVWLFSGELGNTFHAAGTRLHDCAEFLNLCASLVAFGWFFIGVVVNGFTVLLFDGGFLVLVSALPALLQDLLDTNAFSVLSGLLGVNFFISFQEHLHNYNITAM